MTCLPVKQCITLLSNADGVLQKASCRTAGSKSGLQSFRLHFWVQLHRLSTCTQVFLSVPGLPWMILGPGFGITLAAALRPRLHLRCRLQFMLFNHRDCTVFLVVSVHNPCSFSSLFSLLINIIAGGYFCLLVCFYVSGGSTHNEKKEAHG